MEDQNNNYPWMEGNMALLDMLLHNPEELLRALASGQFRPQSMMGGQTFMPPQEAGSPGMQPQQGGMGEIPPNSLPQTQNPSGQFSLGGGSPQAQPASIQQGDPSSQILNLILNGVIGDWQGPTQANDPSQAFNNYDPNTEAYIQAEAAKLNSPTNNGVPVPQSNSPVTGEQSMVQPAKDGVTPFLAQHAQSVTGPMAGITPGVPMGLQIDPFNIHPEEVLANFLLNQGPAYQKVYQQGIENKQKKDEAARLQAESNAKIAESAANIGFKGQELGQQQQQIDIQKQQEKEAERHNLILEKAAQEEAYRSVLNMFPDLPPGIRSQVAQEIVFNNGVLSPETSKQAAQFMSNAQIAKINAERLLHPQTLQPGETVVDTSGALNQISNDISKLFTGKGTQQEQKPNVDLGPVGKEILSAPVTEGQKKSAAEKLGNLYQTHPWMKQMLNDAFSVSGIGSLNRMATTLSDFYKGTQPKAPVNLLGKVVPYVEHLLPQLQTGKYTLEDVAASLKADPETTPEEKVAIIKMLQQRLGQ